MLVALRLLAMLLALFFRIRSCECDFLAMEKVAPCKRERRMRYRWIDGWMLMILMAHCMDRKKFIYIYRNVCVKYEYEIYI